MDRRSPKLLNANTTTYNFHNLYEIHRSPGEPEKHTLYIPGIEGDKVAQYTRSDALLVQANINENKYASIFTDKPDQNSIFDQRKNFLEAKHTLISLFQEIESDIALVWFNIPKHQFYTDNYQMLPSMRALIWLLAFGILIYYALTINTQDEQTSRRLRLATSFALFPFFFASSAGCSPLFFGGAQGEEGTPPWLLLAAVPANTPSVSDEPTFFGGGSGSGASTTNSARITGMYFYHPDHLGSITMITDGRGNVLAGGERGGKSHITYRPYGEILRTDSFGPDISKYKYTGQEEDRESGLYFYKARYYDSKIGRFLQQDSMAFPNQIQGMNRMMYVEGNPVGFRDETGNRISTPLAWGIIGYVGAAQAGKDPLNGFIFGYTFGKNTKKHEQSKLDKNFGLNRAWDSIIGVNGLFRWIKNTTYPTFLVMSQVIHQNACNEDADWNCGNGATYREDYVRTTVKQFWVNKVCSTSDTSPECLLVQIAFTNDYNKKAKSWANKVVRTNYKPAGAECNINPVSGKVKCSGIYNPDEKYPQDPNEENKGR